MPGVRNPFAWLREVFARRNGGDPTQQIRYVLPYPVAGISLTPDECLSLSAVWACIQIIATSIGQCRWNVYEPLGRGRRKLLEDDPLAWVLNTRPNPDMTAIGFREALLFNGIPFGNAYAEIVRDGAGRVAELWPLETDRVTPRRDPATWRLYYEYAQPDLTTVRLEPRQVFHLRGPGLYGLMGENVIARAAKSLGAAAAQERHAAAFFGQGASPSGVLQAPGKVDQETHDRLKSDWAEKKKGPENAHKPIILEAGWKYEAIAANPKESQLVEGRQFSVEEICRWFGVPPHKVQHLLHATFSNIEHQSIEFVRDACNPWTRRLEQEADFKLFPQARGPWRYTCIDTAPLTAGDSKTRAEGASILRVAGLATANELRAREGLDDLGPEGDVLLVQGAMTTIDRVINPPDPAPALPPGRSPAPGGDDEEPEDDDVAEDLGDAAAVARRAVVVLLEGALSRHSERIRNRRADLIRSGVDDVRVEENIQQLRAQWRERLVDELASATSPATEFARRGGVQLTPELVRQAENFVATIGTAAEAAAAAVKLLPAGG